MKKSELTQLTQIIEHLVAREVRKQLPVIITETLRDITNKQVVTEGNQINQPLSTKTLLDEDEHVIEERPVNNFRASLRELFAGTPVMRSEEDLQPKKEIKYTKNPLLNQILNETTSDLRSRERLVGAAAFQGGYSPSLDMIPGFNPNMVRSESPEPVFMQNVPTIPISKPPILAEGQESSHAPMAAIPEGVSALDVAKQVAAPAVQQALTRNYSHMMKLIDKKRGKV